MSIISIGCSIVLTSGVASILYILKMYNRKGSEKGFLGKLVSPLPDTQKLDVIAYHITIWSFPLSGLDIMLGIIQTESAWGRFWGWDPKETMVLIIRIIYTLYPHARTTSGWRNTKVAWINISGFVTMVSNLFFINMIVSGLRFYAGLN